MRVLRIDPAVCFNVWTSHGTWFWSLIYPDRDGGAIGAATSEAQALHEAHAAIERLPHRHDTIKPLVAPREDSKFIRGFHSSNDSQLHIGGKMEVARGEFACFHAFRRRWAKMPTSRTELPQAVAADAPAICSTSRQRVSRCAFSIEGISTI